MNNDYLVVTLSYEELAEAMETYLRSTGDILPHEQINYMDIPVPLTAEGNIDIEVQFVDPLLNTA